MTTLTLTQARRLALAAQGFGGSRDATVTRARVNRAIDQVGLIQIDTVNVLVRAHLMPLFARLGPYDIELLNRAWARPPRRVFEYWGHEASLIDINLYQAWRWKMAAAGQHAWGRMLAIQRDQPKLVDEVLAAVAARGPLTARDLDDGRPRDRTHWGWNWSVAKTALEWLFYSGRVACCGRTSQFERIYDLPERVIPPQIWAQPALSRDEAHRTLVARAARALGVATVPHLADYFRLKLPDARQAVDELADAGELVPTTVEGWRDQAWTPADVRKPRPLHASALLSPFDSLVFDRRRLSELFGVDFRIEIYTPAAQRRWGYYVYLYLHDDAIAARVDLKADRGRGVLLVRTAWHEPSRPDTPGVARGLAAELVRLAGWLGLDDVQIEPRGDLAGELSRGLDAAMTPVAQPQDGRSA